MAGELKLTLLAQFAKGTAKADIGASSPKLIDVTGNTYLKQVQTVGTTAEALLTGDTGAAGFLVVKNLDDTINAEVTVNDGTNEISFSVLKPGESCVVRRKSGNTYKAKSASSTVNLEYMVVID